MDKISKPGYVLIRLASKEQRYVRAECMATVGAVSNPLHYLRNLVPPSPPSAALPCPAPSNFTLCCAMRRDAMRCGV